MRVEIRKGGLDNYLWKIKALERGAPVLRDRISYLLAERLFEIVHQHIDMQDLQWPPLKVEYRAEKIRLGLSEKMWEATGELRSHIRIRKRYDGYAVGIPNSEWHGGANMPAWKLARVHEYGQMDLGIPARPLFRPSSKEVKSWWSANRRVILKSYMKQFTGISLKSGGTLFETGEETKPTRYHSAQIEFDFGDLGSIVNSMSPGASNGSDT